MKNNENPFSRRPRNETMEITNNEVGRRKMAAKRVVGAEPPARPEVYARLEDNRVPLSRYFVPLRLVAPRYAPHLPRHAGNVAHFYG